MTDKSNQTNRQDNSSKKKNSGGKGANPNKKGGGRSKRNRRRYFRRKKSTDEQTTGSESKESQPARDDEDKRRKARRNRRRRRSKQDAPEKDKGPSIVEQIDSNYVAPESVYIYTHVLRPAESRESYEYRSEHFSSVGRRLEDFRIDLSSLFGGDDSPDAPIQLKISQPIDPAIWEENDEDLDSESDGNGPPDAADENIAATDEQDPG